jgi:beta-N-acetylhexosaminidase
MSTNAAITDWNHPVDDLLSTLSLEEKVAQLIHTTVNPCAETFDLARDFGGISPGGVFLFPGTQAQMKAAVEAINQACPVKPLISSDLENGAGRMIKDATVFPDLMGIAAADNEAWARQVGEAAALEGRACGIHWSFGPVVDINANPSNPITNTRSFGDDPERIARLSSALIRGMQDAGMAATAKHFPGDGFDDRDQHICTTVNPLSVEDWHRLSGRMFKSAIDAGVWTMMTGHIALPSVAPGPEGTPESALPCTLEPRLIDALLRRDLGFNGLVISDAMGMGGVTSRGRRANILVDAVNAGCDMVLFTSPDRDYQLLLEAARSGKISPARLDEAVRRVLALKQKLFAWPTEPVSPERVDTHRQWAAMIANQAITLRRDERGCLPLGLAEGARILSFHVRGDPAYHVDAVDAQLRARGYDVHHVDESSENFPPESELEAYDALLIHFVYGPTWCTGRIRPAGNIMRPLTGLVAAHHPRTIMISYGSPYIEREFPHAPCVIDAYSPDPATIEAVINVLTGAIKPQGRSPVQAD